MSDFLWPDGLKHARLPCPSLSPWVCSNSHPLSWWCHPTISSSATLFAHPQSFPASVFSNELLLCIRWLKSGISASSVLPMNLQDWLLLGLTRLLFLLSKGLAKVFSSTTILKHQFFSTQPTLWSNSHINTRLLEKIKALTMWTFVGKVMSLLFNTLCRFVIAFLPRTKYLWISWLQSLATVILEFKKIKFVTISTFSTSFCHTWWDWMPWSSFFEYWVLRQLFHCPLSPSSRVS